MQIDNEPAATKRRLPQLSTQILLAMAGGTGVGIFFGDLCSPLETIGTIYVDLMQMTVFPYIVVTIIARVGRLTWVRLRLLAAAGGKVLLLLWAIGALLICLFPLALPVSNRGSFYSAATVDRPEPLGLIDQVVVANPFSALANGTIPAIVLISVLLGISLSGLADKGGLLDLLGVVERMLQRINSGIVKLTPIGVFAICASGAGTMQLEEASRLEAYFLIQIAASAATVFFLLPVLVAAITPFSYRAIVGNSLSVIMTAFVAGKVVVVIPLIIETTRSMIQRRGSNVSETEDAIDAIVPLAYSFPHLGRLLALMFIPFAAWFVGQPMESSDYPGFMVTGYLSMFGSTMVAMPYLLDAQRIPADLMQLFVVSGVVCGRLSDAVGAMHLFAIALATPYVLAAGLRHSLLKLALYTGASFLVISAIVVPMRVYLSRNLPDERQRSQTIARLHAPVIPLGSAKVSRELPQRDNAAFQYESSTDRIRETKTVRVGYLKNNLPWSFFNANDELVGFDVDMARKLASDLDVQLEFVPFRFDTLEQQLTRGDFDVAMSGILVTPTRLLRMSFSEPYMDVSLAFVVKDHLRRQFSTMESIAGLKKIRIAVPQSHYFVSHLRARLPQFDIVAIDSQHDFFVNDVADAMLLNAEAGSAWTITYPNYAVVVPTDATVSRPLGYAVAIGDSRASETISRWVQMTRQSDDYHRIYDHWILGKTPQSERPRWSVIRDVLHWID